MTANTPAQAAALRAALGCEDLAEADDATIAGALQAAFASDTAGAWEARLEAASKLLEGSFYQELFKAMRATVPEGGVISGGSGEDVFTGLLDQHISDAAAMRSTRGLGQALYAHFTRGVGSKSTSGEGA